MEYNWQTNAYFVFARQWGQTHLVGQSPAHQNNFHPRRQFPIPTLWNKGV